MFDKNRFLSMTDAIVAVAATIMVLKLNIPEHASLEAAREQFPVLLAYIVSFIQIFLDSNHYGTLCLADVTVDYSGGYCGQHCHHLSV